MTNTSAREALGEVFREGYSERLQRLRRNLLEIFSMSACVGSTLIILSTVCISPSAQASPATQSNSTSPVASVSDSLDSPASSPDDLEPAGDPNLVAHLNIQFRKFYANARLRRLERVGPVIILEGEEAKFCFKDRRESVKLIPKRYSLLKTIAHVPLALFVRLSDRTGRPLDEHEKRSLFILKDMAKNVEEELPLWKLPKDALARQHEILRESYDLIDTTMKEGSIERDALIAFCRKLAPLVMENAYESVSLELSRLDAGVGKWKKSVSEEEWKKLYVLIISSHMPREEERASLYFFKLLNESRLGHRIVYFEGNADDEDKAIESLGTHILDREIGAAFFNDDWRMHRDLLSDGAKRYLKEHPPLEEHPARNE